MINHTQQLAVTSPRRQPGDHSLANTASFRFVTKAVLQLSGILELSKLWNLSSPG